MTNENTVYAPCAPPTGPIRVVGGDAVLQPSTTGWHEIRADMVAKWRIWVFSQWVNVFNHFGRGLAPHDVGRYIFKEAGTYRLETDDEWGVRSISSRQGQLELRKPPSPAQDDLDAFEEWLANRAKTS